MDDWPEEKRKAAIEVLRALRNPLYMMAQPNRERAYKAAEDHQLTAVELLDTMRWVTKRSS